MGIELMSWMVVNPQNSKTQFPWRANCLELTCVHVERVSIGIKVEWFIYCMMKVKAILSFWSSFRENVATAKQVFIIGRDFQSVYGIILIVQIQLWLTL